MTARFRDIEYVGGTTRETLAQAAQIVEAAAKRIETYGWTQGAHARTTENLVCRVMDPEAAYFSIYGAIDREMVNAGLTGGDIQTQTSLTGMAIWTVLTRQGVAERIGYSGVHPVIEFNDAHGRTQAEVTGFLRDCARTLENGSKE